MVLIAFLLGTAEPAIASVSPPSAASQAADANSKFPIVREIGKIGGSGSTLIGFNIDKNGKAFGCNVLEPSGSTFLDAKACETVMDKAKFRPAMNEKGKPIPIYGKTVRIRWNIEG